ncbi:hypothetical protein FHETE_9068 [Fusarium heterosporum]|uniref:Endonuclease/exonuclease/phosphatase domain-containing protein n=1 Tax=Fusarium heterosporum TaxID=42747 RepID=A0A8H5T0G2_FUSHE|nr:hypothetical protein FHETE_9068 [Fusarium heterosporum]
MTASGEVAIHNVHNTNSTHEQISIDHLVHRMAGLELRIVVGDFNLHHISWAGDLLKPGQTSALAHDLADKMKAAGMELITEKGCRTYTWSSREDDSTALCIDLTFVSQDLKLKPLTWSVDDNSLWDKSDHRPIRTVLTLTNVLCKRVHYKYDKAALGAYQEMIAAKMAGLSHCPLDSKADLDRAAHMLLEEVGDCLDKCIPTCAANPPPRSKYPLDPSIRLTLQTEAITIAESGQNLTTRHSGCNDGGDRKRTRSSRAINIVDTSARRASSQTPKPSDGEKAPEIPFPRLDPNRYQFEMDRNVDEAIVDHIIRQLPSEKASGYDKIANEATKMTRVIITCAALALEGLAMTGKVNFADLPTELKQQIYREYFKVKDGFIYYAQSDSLKTADNRSIELSLMFTCRSIANDTRHLPLSLNSVQFSALYRQDWQNLAGCFNLVATYHRILQSDFVMHLARFMTPDMFSQLAAEYPEFESRLRQNMRNHQRWIEELDEDLESPTTNSDDENPFNELRHGMCATVRYFADYWSDNGTIQSDCYRGFATVDNWSEHDLQGFWPGTYSEIQDCLSYCLHLLAEKKPTEFATHVSRTFPRWTGTRHVEDFMSLEFKPWAIPSKAEVIRAIKLLDLGDVWELPNNWYYTPSYHYNEDYENDPPSFLSPNFDRRGHVHVPFGVRCREKIRFSAVANAIRFFERRLSADQRTQIRSLVLHEDFTSVNQPSCHMHGLVAFFKENPLLRVERRADWLRCVVTRLNRPSDVATNLQLGRDREPELYWTSIGRDIARWLFDALAATKTDVPATSFVFVLEAGSHRNFATDMFQRYVHRGNAWARAYKQLTESGLLIMGEVSYLVDRSMDKYEHVEVIDHLVNNASTVLRCDFNTGIPWNYETLVNETMRLSDLEWFETWRERSGQTGRSTVRLAPDITYESWVADHFEVQTEHENMHPITANK